MSHSLVPRQTPQHPPRQPPWPTVAWFVTEVSARSQSLGASASPPRRPLCTSHLPARLVVLQSSAWPSGDRMDSLALKSAKIAECMSVSSSLHSSPSWPSMSSLLPLGMTPFSGPVSRLSLWSAERPASSDAPGLWQPLALLDLRAGPTTRGSARRNRRIPQCRRGRVVRVVPTQLLNTSASPSSPPLGSRASQGMQPSSPVAAPRAVRPPGPAEEKA